MVRKTVRVENSPQVASIFERIGSASKLTSGTSVTFENLSNDISEGDIQQLCSTIGVVKVVTVKLDQFKRSTGCAEAIFERRSDAEAAVAKFSELTLDGKPLKCFLTGRSGKQNPFN